MDNGRERRSRAMTTAFGSTKLNISMMRGNHSIYPLKNLVNIFLATDQKQRTQINAF